MVTRTQFDDRQERDRARLLGHGTVVEVRAPRVGGGYRLMVEPWRALSALEGFDPTSIEVSDKSTLLPVTSWARRRGVRTVLLSHERLDAMIALRTGFTAGVNGTVGALNRILVRQYDAVVVTSRFAMREFTPLARNVGTPLHRVPLGVDLEAFRPQEAPCEPRHVARGRTSRSHPARARRSVSPSSRRSPWAHRS